MQMECKCTGRLLLDINKRTSRYQAEKKRESKVKCLICSPNYNKILFVHKYCISPTFL
jgi:hypothetical protein